MINPNLQITIPFFAFETILETETAYDEYSYVITAQADIQRSLGLCRVVLEDKELFPANYVIFANRAFERERQLTEYTQYIRQILLPEFKQYIDSEHGYIYKVLPNLPIELVLKVRDYMHSDMYILRALKSLTE